MKRPNPVKAKTVWIHYADALEEEYIACESKLLDLREAVGNLLNDNSPQNREDVYALLDGEADDECK